MAHGHIVPRQFFEKSGLAGSFKDEYHNFCQFYPYFPRLSAKTAGSFQRVPRQVYRFRTPAGQMVKPIGQIAFHISKIFITASNILNHVGETVNPAKEIVNC